LFALVFDTETDGLITTLAAKQDRLPQILSLYYNVVNLETGTSMATESFLFKPSKPIPEDMTKIHGITNEMVKDAPAFVEKADFLFDAFMAMPLVIAHNAQFDTDMLRIEMQRCNREMRFNRVLCTVEQTIWLEGYRLSLTNLYKLLFNRDFEEKHSASGDVTALSECCVELYKRGWL
jgi:DNA polymerase III epsilon subunit-like protein